jgi:hypothetical protein
VRGGSSCISDENSVMELERRGCVNPKENIPNRKKEDGYNCENRRIEV